ncbi:MAG: hypothetical protein N2V78_06545 [Methanophagales archaeon]|nr:hypothetical protein [Methanophagales archaeon]
MELGLPWETSNRARPPGYDWVKQLSAILIKGMRSFVNLATDLRSAKYGMTTSCCLA